MVNLLGINYDVTLGKKNQLVDWMALRSPPQRAPVLYEKLMQQYAQTKDIEVKEIQVEGPAPGQYIDVRFPREGVQFRFLATSKDLYSVVVRGKP